MNASGDNRKSIVILEDHPVMREGLSVWFSGTGRWQVQKTVSGLEEAKHFFSRRPAMPDVTLLDIQLRDGWGLDLIPWLAEHRISVPLLAVYSAFDDYVYVNAAVSLGVKAYVCKHRGPAELEAALETALGGAVHIDRDAEIKFRVITDGINLLTKRESEILILVKSGLSNKQIAARLAISRRTVENLLSCVYDKLGLHSRHELRRLER